MILFVDTNHSEPFDFLDVLDKAREKDTESLDALFKRFYPKVERMVQRGRLRRLPGDDRPEPHPRCDPLP